MTNTNTNNLFGSIERPIVKSSNPTLYEQHTFHMSKASKYTYNYSVIDDYVMENYVSMTAKEMATNLNEYPNRIIYRVKTLQTLGILPVKVPSMTSEGRLRKEYIQSWEQTITLYKALMVKNPDALAG
jgi:hypothetical protein|tara:strand:- start:311 stop:694 length:384 start_codon:yes stop_codon:yes gene_type:complete